MTERTTVRLPDELVRRAKQRASAEGRTLTALIEEGLRRVVSERPSERAARVLPRVSSASGGLKRGFNWDTLAKDTEEMEDLERLERSR